MRQIRLVHILCIIDQIGLPSVLIIIIYNHNLLFQFSKESQVKQI